MAINPELTGGNRMIHESQAELWKLLEEFDSAVINLAKDPTLVEAQCRVCLSSRSAYTEFFAVSELEVGVDQTVAEKLRILFSAALKHLPNDCIYFESVRERFSEFEEYVNELAKRPEFDTAVFQ